MSNNTRPQNCSSLGPVQIVNGTVKSAQNDGLRLFSEFAEAMDTWETKFVGKWGLIFYSDATHKLIFFSQNSKYLKSIETSQMYELKEDFKWRVRII